MGSRLLGKILTESSALFVCDIQQKFVPLIHDMPRLVQHASTLIKGCQELNVPIVGTEQYPKALGSMIDEVSPSTYKVYPKTLFSMYIPEIKSRLKGGDLSHKLNVDYFLIDIEVLVGQEAKNLAFSNASNTIFNLKQLIGKKFSKIEDFDMLPFKVIPDELDNPKVSVTVNGTEKFYSPEEMVSFIFSKLKKNAEIYLGEPVSISMEI
ncbi:hypothetical protein PPL_07487 [Heterostelium album PN500]|uniref:Isochorismatase-like domain-containing protein n=1 Tax=Heterostelium pallidum (strain ATCC 26659 / Pp 5 / PN500) TaxID=670386 RepID=D3BG36_HETP5|nr:hypothetical protein PPL_07487 [Heterostelium album PN500]EFA79628.1 hypothetical protein PPL_07487 [Heterostelium album PN500]|eukprot:XP_020431749.1 hypothetical protein PPL_07487 [Heterostelium album PN500]